MELVGRQEADDEREARQRAVGRHARIALPRRIDQRRGERRQGAPRRQVHARWHQRRLQTFVGWRLAL